MVSNKELLRRLNVFIRFKGIAKAVQMVAIASLKKYKNKIETRQVSLLVVKELFTLDGFTNNFFFVRERKVLLPITSDRQCTGIINSKVLKGAIKILNRLRRSQNDEVSIFLVGIKGNNIVKRLGLENDVAGICTGLMSEVVCLYTMYSIYMKMLDLEFDKLIIVFNKYFEMFDQRISKYELPSFNAFEHLILQNRQNIPFLKSIIEEKKTNEFFYEDVYYYCSLLVLLDSFEENEYSELGSRAMAMENTLQNTSKVVDILRITYNRARQSKITNELIEVVSASEFMNSESN